MNILRFRSWLRLALLFAALFLEACAFHSRVERHTFAFDARRDSPGIEILDYQYGASRLPGTHPQDWMLKEDKCPQMSNVNGPMVVGDSLYVKWKITSTGEIFQDTVDLKPLLPWNIRDHEIYFIVKERQLYVYLISPERRPPGMSPNGPRASSHLKTITLYPVTSNR